MIVLQKKYSNLAQGLIQAKKYQELINKKYAPIYQLKMREWETEVAKQKQGYQQTLTEWKIETAKQEQEYRQALAEWKIEVRKIRQEKIDHYTRQRSFGLWVLFLTPFICMGIWIITEFIDYILLQLNIESPMSNAFCVGTSLLFFVFLLSGVFTLAVHSTIVSQKKQDAEKAYLTYNVPPKPQKSFTSQSIHKPSPPDLLEKPTSPEKAPQPLSPVLPQKPTMPYNIVSEWLGQMNLLQEHQSIILEDDTYIEENLGGERPIGVKGEVALLYTLNEHLSDEYIAIHSFLLSKNKDTGRGEDADVIVIGPSGVWILESKYYSGYVQYKFTWEHFTRERSNYREEIPIKEPLDKQWERQRKYIQKLLLNKLPDEYKNINIDGGIAFTHPNVKLKLDNPPCKSFRSDKWAITIKNAPSYNPEITRHVQLQILDILLKNSYRFKRSNQTSSLSLLKRIYNQYGYEIDETLKNYT